MKNQKTVQQKTSKEATLIATFIPKNDIERLDGIIKKYKFKSRYQVVQYLIQCFLKVADPQPEEVVNKDIEEMFDGYDSVSRDDFQNVKNKYSI